MASRRLTAAERRERAAGEERAREKRASEQRRKVLQLRSAGMPYSDIALDQERAADDVRADGTAVLAERARDAEPPELASTLELERLDGLERRAQTVLAWAAIATQGTVRDARLALLAIDRLLLIGEQRRQIRPPQPEAGDVEQAVRGQIATYPAKIQERPEAQAAVLLARRLDSGLAATDLPAVVRELRMVLQDLAALSPPAGRQSKVGELRDRRKLRLVGEGDG